MGPAFAESVILNLEATWEESDPRTPLICFLSMGSDPTNQIESLAKKLQLGKLLHIPAEVWLAITSVTWVSLLLHFPGEPLCSVMF